MVQQQILDMEPSRKCMDVVDQKFRILYVLLLNSITVKNMNFQVYTYIERVYYPKANRKLYRSYLTNYVHFLSPFQVHYLKFAKAAQNR